MAKLWYLQTRSMKVASICLPRLFFSQNVSQHFAFFEHYQMVMNIKQPKHFFVWVKIPKSSTFPSLSPGGHFLCRRMWRVLYHLSEPVNMFFMGLGTYPLSATVQKMGARRGYRNTINIRVPQAILILYMVGAPPTS